MPKRAGDSGDPLEVVEARFAVDPSPLSRSPLLLSWRDASGRTVSGASLLILCWPLAVGDSTQKRTLSDMNDQQFGDKEMQIVRAAFQDAAAATGRLHPGVWDLAAINESITKSGIAMGTLKCRFQAARSGSRRVGGSTNPGYHRRHVHRKAQFGKRS